MWVVRRLGSKDEKDTVALFFPFCFFLCGRSPVSFSHKINKRKYLFTKIVLYVWLVWSVSDFFFFFFYLISPSCVAVSQFLAISKSKKRIILTMTILYMWVVRCFQCEEDTVALFFFPSSISPPCVAASQFPSLHVPLMPRLLMLLLPRHRGSWSLDDCKAEVIQ